VTERTVKVSELAEALKDGRLREIFTCGTAVTIGSVDKIHIRG